MDFISRVRLAEKQDVVQIARLYNDSFPEHIMVQRKVLNNPVYLADRCNNPDEVWAVEEQNGIIRGIAALAIIPPVGLGEIERVCVDRNTRGQGIAYKISDLLLNAARARNLGFVEAWARGDQPAMQRTFEKLGFKVYGVAPRFEVVHDEEVVREQFVHMGLELKPETVDERTMCLIPSARSIYDKVHQ